MGRGHMGKTSDIFKKCEDPKFLYCPDIAITQVLSSMPVS